MAPLNTSFPGILAARDKWLLAGSTPIQTLEQPFRHIQYQMVQTNRTSSCTLQWTYNSKVLLNQMVLNLSKLARTPASIPDQVPCQLQSSVIPFSAIFMAILSPQILLKSVVEVSKVLNQVVAPGKWPSCELPSCWPLVYLW